MYQYQSDMIHIVTRRCYDTTDEWRYTVHVQWWRYPLVLCSMDDAMAANDGPDGDDAMAMATKGTGRVR